MQPEHTIPIADPGPGPLMFRIKGTVILRIWWQILFVLVYTGMVTFIHVYVPEMKMNFPQTLIPVLGVVTGLLLVFRTNTAYDRYWEGRRLWSVMTLNIRTLSRGIWVGVKEHQGKDVVEKMTIINLLVAFVIATKHYLREEYSYEFDDMKDLLLHLPRFATPSSNQPLKKKEEKTLLFTAHDFPTPSNIPLEISYYLASYLSNVIGRNQLDASLVVPLQNAVTALVECLTNFERILRTPIPLAYSVHLHHSIWLYLVALPYQLVGALVWWTIPAVGLASFSLLGILGIGWEIENPFGYDDNDLPLDDFCDVLRREIRMICGNRLPAVQEWIFSPLNCPLTPTCELNAQELSTRTVEQVHDILLQGNEAMLEEIKVNEERRHSRLPRRSSAFKENDDAGALLIDPNPTRHA